MSDGTTHPLTAFKDFVNSARSVIEGLILVGIIWIASSLNQQSIAITRLQVQMTQIQTQLGGVPSMTTTLAQVQVEQQEDERRISKLENKP